MWDTYRLPRFGNFSLRKIALLFIAATLSALFVAIAQSTTTFAAPATWEGDTLKYDSKTFTKQAGTFPGIGSDYDTYVYKENDQATKASVIAVPKNADKTKEITNVTVREYDVDTGNVFSSPGPPTTITVAAPAAGGEENVNKTSCDIAGVGWIICGPARWIANGMDLIYGWISDFLTVRPLSDDTQNGMYLAWDVVRGIANACFILAFLVIIYSQITSYGINNYEIKKMIPRLIIAAVLVNVSYYICAYAVDLSNIMGNAIQNAFIEVRESLINSQNTSEGWDATTFSFKNVTEYILSGGALAGGAFMGLTAFAGGAIGGSVSGLVFMLFPVLIAGVVSVTVALIILAARQALITVLIVISPLAFVAFLLPNTDKWFEKWRGLSMTMLMVFPLFSLLFGGSQLASYLILQNADQLTIVLLALFIQVAPLALTPFLLQFSGSLLGRLAGMVNNPQRGIIDRASNYAKDRAEVRKARGMEDAAKGRGTAMQRYAFRREQSRLNRESWKKRGEAFTDASWHNDSRYGMHHDALGEADLRKNVGESHSNLHFERRKSADDRLRQYVGTQRFNEEGTKMLQSHQDMTWEEMKSEKMTPDNYFRGFAQEARAVSGEHQVIEERLSVAKSMQAQEHVAELRASTALQQRVGGIDPHGATKAYSKAKAASYAAKAEIVKNIENGSDIMPGRTMEMVAEFERGIRDNEVETVRAMINKLAASANPGTIALRDVMTRKQDELAAAGMLDEVKFHLDGHPDLNSGAEDIVTFSRDQGNRRIEAIGSDASTWSNMTATKFMGQKQSTQEVALGTGGIDRSTLRDIIRNPGKINLKPKVLKQIRTQLGIALDGSQDDTI